LRVVKSIIIFVFCLSLVGVPAMAKTKKHEKTHAKKSRHAKKVKRSKKSRGQQAISEDRVRDIQLALARENYLQEEPTGVLDPATRSALVKYQEDNGWQSKVVPDARALIKLGLGPSRENLLNPETAAVADPTTLVAGGQR